MGGPNDTHPNDPDGEEKAKLEGDIDEFFGPETEEGADRTVAEAAAEAKAKKPEPEPEPEPEPDPEPDPEPEPDANGTKTPFRSYTVFSVSKLDKDTLEGLLQQVEDGVVLEAYFLVEALEARNGEHALRMTWAKHAEAFGEQAKLAPIPTRYVNPKLVKPRKRVEENLEIS